MIAVAVVKATGWREINFPGLNCRDMPLPPAETQSKPVATTKKTLVELLDDIVVYAKERRKKLLAELKAAKEVK